MERKTDSKIEDLKVNETRRRVLMSVPSLLALAPMSMAAAQAPIRVAVAANFAGPMMPLAQQFEQETGFKVSISVGATGKFYAQIRQGAPFDVLLAGDAQTVQKLVDEGLAEPAERFTYAIGQLALWSPKADLFKDQAQAITRLKEGSFGRLAMANPAVAPYGAAAQAVLAQLGLAKAWTSKRVLGQSVGQAYQFVASGNADWGFVALSQIQLTDQPTTGSVWLPPLDWYAPLKQDAVLLSASQSPSAAKAFLNFLREPRARAMIQGFGYQLTP